MATDIQPDYPLAHAGLARALIFATQPAPAIALRQARQAATRARALDPGNAEAHFYYSHHLTAAGRFDDALAAARRAQTLDPFSPLIHHNVGRIPLFARRPGEAIAQLRQTLDMSPNYSWAHLFLAVAHEQQGDFAAAAAARQRYWAVMGVPAERVARLKTLFDASGYAAVRREWIDWIQGFVRTDGFVTSAELAILHGALRDTDTALAWLDEPSRIRRGSDLSAGVSRAGPAAIRSGLPCYRRARVPAGDLSARHTVTSGDEPHYPDPGHAHRGGPPARRQEAFPLTPAATARLTSARFADTPARAPCRPRL
jgi:hypothetical protein